MHSQNIKGNRKDQLSSTEISPRKCNLSFSFDVDGKATENENSSDSETTNLRINIEEVDNYEPPRKRMRVEINDVSAINEMEAELERQLDEKAAKINLTATNVKNIIKNLITNELVLAMVKKELNNSDEGPTFEPKLTRAKAKYIKIIL